MRKRIITTDHQEDPILEQGWLNIDELAEVELSSEDASYPIEHALMPGRTSGWRAAVPGKQTIRIIFSHPQQLRRVWLKFEETIVERTQEYVLRWSPDGGKSFRDIVRQQWNFSPAGASTETEDHHVDLPTVAMLELMIIPDIGGGSAIASLAQFRLA